MGDQSPAVVEEEDHTRLSELLRAQEGVNVGEQYVAGDYAAPRRRERRPYGVPGKVGNLEQIRVGNGAGAGLEGADIPGPVPRIVVRLALRLGEPLEVAG